MLHAAVPSKSGRKQTTTTEATKLSALRVQFGGTSVAPPPCNNGGPDPGAMEDLTPAPGLVRSLLLLTLMTCIPLEAAG
jgi:hypothetical protein